ncbi:hypothetical protein ACJX0J_030637, partial [Zea mays]
VIGYLYGGLGIYFIIVQIQIFKFIGMCYWLGDTRGPLVKLPWHALLLHRCD